MANPEKPEVNSESTLQEKEYTNEEILKMDDEMNNFYFWLKGNYYSKLINSNIYQKKSYEQARKKIEKQINDIDKIVKDEFPKINPEQLEEKDNKLSKKDTELQEMSDEEKKKNKEEKRTFRRKRTALTYPLYKRLIEIGYDGQELNG